MSMKHLVAASVLLTFTAVSGVAYAEPQASAKKPFVSQPQSAVEFRGDQAMASARFTSKNPSIAAESGVSKYHQYRGGPRSIY